MVVTLPALALLATLVAAAPEEIWLDRGEGGRLGVTIGEVGAEDAKTLKLPEERGAKITFVEEESAASAAGLKAGDVIWEFRGEPVWSVGQLRRLVDETPPGREVPVRYYRDGALQSARVRLKSGARAGMRLFGPNFDFDLNFPRDVPALRHLERHVVSSRPRLGVSVSPLTTQLAEHLGAREGGLLVMEVDSDSPAQKAGIKAGDVIEKVNGRRVESLGELRRAISEGDEASVELVRDKKPLTLKVALPTGAKPGRRM